MSDTEKRILGLVKRIDSKKQKLDDARGDLGTIYAEVEDIGEHRQALKFALKLRDMEDDKRNDFLRKLQEYCDILNIGAQGDLIDETPKPPPPRGPRVVDADFDTHGAA